MNGRDAYAFTHAIGRILGGRRMPISGVLFALRLLCSVEDGGADMRLISDEALASVVIWQEARGEPMDARVGVAEAIRRRVETKWGGCTSIPEVVFAHFQFSGMNDDNPWRGDSFALDDDDPIVQSCIEAWRRAEAGSNLTHGATFFLNVELTRKQRGGSLPSWYDPKRVTATLGQLTFLR